MKTPSKRKMVMWLCGYRCYYCGRKPTKTKPLTLDHMRPKYRGGTNDVENLVAACEGCNFDKGGLTVDEYKTRLRKQKGKGYKFWGERDPEIASRVWYSELKLKEYLERLTPLGATEEDYR